MRVRMRAAGLIALVLVLAGCAGAEGQEAQQILKRSLAAGAKVESATFEADLTVNADGTMMTAALRGGGYLKGPRAGEMYLSAKLAGVPGFDGTFGVVTRGRYAFVGLNGKWERMPLPQDARSDVTASFAPKAFEELAQYVKDVRVTEQVVNGERSVTIAGELDTEAMIEGLAKLTALSDAVGGGPDMSGVAETFGDTEIVLVVSRETDLITAAMVRLNMKADGKAGEIRLAYRLTSANVPVAFPKTTQ